MQCRGQLVVVVVVVGGGWDAVALNGGGWGPMDEAALDVVAGVGLSDGDLYPVYAGAVAGALSKGDWNGAVIVGSYVGGGGICGGVVRAFATGVGVGVGVGDCELREEDAVGVWIGSGGMCGRF